jgi:ATP-dependent 26S proteasome regulatory subunit
MYPKTWSQIESYNFNTLLKKEVEKITPSYSYKRSFEAELSFYPDTRLVKCQLSNAEGKEKYLFGLVRNNYFFPLNFSNDSIYGFNERFGIHLTPETVIEYTLFFFSYVRGKHGFFHILPSPSDLPLDREQKNEIIYCPSEEDPENKITVKPEAWANLFSKTILPPKIIEQPDPNVYNIETSILFKDSLFHAMVILETNGMIKLTGEKLVLENIPLVATEDNFIVPANIVAGPVEENVLNYSHPEQSIEPFKNKNVLLAISKTLLAESILQSNKHIFFTSANTTEEVDDTFRQFLNMVRKTRPVVVFESKLPYFEDLVADMLLGEKGNPFRKITPNLRGTQNMTLEVPPVSNDNLLVLSMHSVNGINNENLVTHEITTTDSVAFIGCSSFQKLPESLRSLTDIILKIPDINASTFRKIFTTLYSADQKQLSDSVSLSWTGMLLPNDIVQVCRLNLGAENTLKSLEERVNARMKSVSTDHSPSLDDLHGLGEAKAVARDMIADIKLALEGKISWNEVDKGMLIVGPPGTGKTTLAKAIARECGVKFIVVSASRWQSSEHLGHHIAAIMSDFELARRCAPSILFIDELDSVGARSSNTQHAFYGNMVVNTILQEIQGFSEKEKVIIIAATNQEQLVDPALKRSGRLDRVLNVGYPTVGALENIYNYYLKAQVSENKLNPDVNTRELACLSFGLTGADVESIVRGALRRARKDSSPLSKQHLVDEITGKPRDSSDSRIITSEEMRRIAVHESGHALIQLLNPESKDNLAYISIVPRNNGTLGFVANIPSELVYRTRENYTGILEILLAGRAAEELIYGKKGISSGSGADESGDLAKATNMAGNMIMKYGFGKKTGLLFQNITDGDTKNEIKKLLRTVYRSAFQRIRKNKDLLIRMVDILVEKQEISGNEMKEMLNI